MNTHAPWRVSRSARTTPVEQLSPHAEILRELTDEALSDPQGSYRGDVRELLLTIPAEWRQTAVAERMARENDYMTRMTPDGMSEGNFQTVNPNQLPAIVAEIREHLALKES